MLNIVEYDRRDNMREYGGKAFLNENGEMFIREVECGKTWDGFGDAEIEMTKLVQARSADEHRSILKSHSVLDEAVSIRHSADTSNMETLTYKQLYSWLGEDYKDKFDALNNLYTINNKS